MILNKLTRRLRTLFSNDQMIAWNLQTGTDAEEAQPTALNTLGGLGKRDVSETRRMRVFEDFWQDLRYGARMLLKSPLVSILAVLTITLGIGATTAVFSVVNTVILRPLPYQASEQLVIVWDRVARLGLNRNIVSPANYLDWQAQNHSFETMGAYTEAFFNLTDDVGGSPERIAAMIVTPSLFPTLGVSPIEGRTFATEEQQCGGNNNRPCIVVISHSLKQRRFGQDANPIGKSVTLNGNRFTVIGILPAEFMITPKKVEAFLPMNLNAEQRQNRAGRYLTVIGRLKSGSSVKQAQADMDGITARLAQQYPDVNQDRGASVVPIQQEVFGKTRITLLLLLGAVGCVLLIASANVANLLLARFNSRRHEIAVRNALGATRSRLVRQLLAESIPLTVLGSVLGLIVALLGMPLLAAFSPESIPRIQELKLDRNVLVFTFAISTLTGLLFGLFSALHGSKQDTQSSLKESGTTISGGRRHKRVRNTLVVAEVALSIVLLIGAGLMLKTLVSLLRVDPGFLADQTVAMDVSLSGRYREPEMRSLFFQQLVERVEALPGVRSAGVTDNLPLSGEDAARQFAIVGEASTQNLQAEHRRISPDYFDAMGIVLLKGRRFAGSDTDKSPGVVIINESLARHFLQNQNPLGRQIIIKDGPPRPREIVGIVRDVKHFGLDIEVQPEMYVPQLDRPWPNMTLVVRADGVDPLSLTAAVRSEVSALDKSIPLANVKTVDQYVIASISQRRFTMFLLGSFGAIALLLAAIGIYGVTSYSVALRGQEVGIRMALGAGTVDVLRLIIWEGIKPTLLGAGIGLAAALALTRLMQSLLFGVTPRDWPTFLFVSCTLSFVALLACYVPARRATKIDPLKALRVG